MKKKKLEKLIDELLIDLMTAAKLTPAEIENYSSITRKAINVIRKRYQQKRFPITVTWCNYFDYEEVHQNQRNPNSRGSA